VDRFSCKRLKSLGLFTFTELFFNTELIYFFISFLRIVIGEINCYISHQCINLYVSENNLIRIVFNFTHFKKLIDHMNWSNSFILDFEVNAVIT